MIEKMIQIQKQIEAVIKADSAKTDWKKEYKNFNIFFEHLQKERLIHLLVTLAVGIVSLIVFFGSLQHLYWPLFILDGIFFVLFVFYILYYRRLENLAQSWYDLLEKLSEKDKKDESSATGL